MVISISSCSSFHPENPDSDKVQLIKCQHLEIPKRRHDYAEKYSNREGITIYEPGQVFSKTKCNLVQADYVTASV
jgi:hypothetical protein